LAIKGIFLLPQFGYVTPEKTGYVPHFGGETAFAGPVS
jgi:hypothetical protein